jgi:hypothetical protein
MSLKEELEALKRLGNAHKENYFETLSDEPSTFYYPEPEKKSSLSVIANIASIITPFVVNHKINQLTKEIQELKKNQPKIDPQTGLKRFL